MKLDRLDRMIGGWFVGNFSPTAFASKNFEVAVKRYRSGDVDAWHEHRVATEITVILEGTARMADRTLVAGDIVVLYPGEPSSFAAVSDCLVVCVKTPSAPGDKYMLDR